MVGDIIIAQVFLITSLRFLFKGGRGIVPGRRATSVSALQVQTVCADESTPAQATDAVLDAERERNEAFAFLSRGKPVCGPAFQVGHKLGSFPSPPEESLLGCHKLQRSFGMKTF
jgi:hypothetical protein